MTESMYTGMSLVMTVSKSLIYTNSPNTGSAYRDEIKFVIILKLYDATKENYLKMSALIQIIPLNNLFH